MGLTPIPMIPTRLSELDRYRLSITPKQTTEHLWFSVAPVLLVIALVALVAYALLG